MRALLVLQRFDLKESFLRVISVHQFSKTCLIFLLRGLIAWIFIQEERRIAEIYLSAENNPIPPSVPGESLEQHVGLEVASGTRAKFALGSVTVIFHPALRIRVGHQQAQRKQQPAHRTNIYLFKFAASLLISAKREWRIAQKQKYTPLVHRQVFQRSIRMFLKTHQTRCGSLTWNLIIDPLVTKSMGVILLKACLD